MKPFRWTISKREQLGTLVGTAGPMRRDPHGFLSDLRAASARLVALADDADFAFIGRTPENFFDYLSGVFADVDEAPALHLVHFSLRWAGGLRSLAPESLKGFFDYLVEEGIDAASICAAPRPLALVDYVARGGTMESFVELLKLQAERQSADWNAVQRRLKIVGLRTRTHNSPNTWRWQQHQDWLHIIPDVVIKNVSAPARLLYHIANDQPKVTHSFYPGRWAGEDGGAYPVTEEQLAALTLAVRLYETGRTRDERLRFAALLAKTQQMRQPATRRLVSRIKGQ